MSYKIYKNGNWIECAGQPDLTPYALQSDLELEAQTREEVDNGFEEALRIETQERIDTDNNQQAQINGCYNGAFQNENKLTLTTVGGDSFEYQPTIPAAMAYKGDCLQVDLPTSGQVNGDYWTLTDTEGPFVGKSAIWSEDRGEWGYTGTTIAVEQTVNEGSTTAVSGGGVFEHTRQIIQTIYNAIYPIRCKVIGFTAPSIPAGVEASWEIDNDYNGKYLYIDSGQAPGTSIAEEAVIEGTTLSSSQLPAHTHTIEHYHNRGGMNITGNFGNLYTGATPTTTGAFSSTQKGDNVSYTKSGTANSWRKYTFKASDNWSGLTSKPRNSSDTTDVLVTGTTGEGATHTHNIGHIKTAGVVVNVWKRTA